MTDPVMILLILAGIAIYTAIIHAVMEKKINEREEGYRVLKDALEFTWDSFLPRVFPDGVVVIDLIHVSESFLPPGKYTGEFWVRHYFNGKSNSYKSKTISAAVDLAEKLEGEVLVFPEGKRYVEEVND